MATRNQTEGHRWERTIAQMLRNTGIHPHVVTCRSTNRKRDGEGIDLCNADEAVHGRMEDDVQAKTTSGNLDFPDLMDTMKATDYSDVRTPVVFWRKTGKSKGGKFMVKGTFAVSFLEDYLRLLRCREAYKAMSPHIKILLTTLQGTDKAQAAVLKKRLHELAFPTD